MTAIHVHSGYSPMNFMLSAVRLRLELDDSPAVEVPWGDWTFPVTPGRHTLRCYFRWSWYRHAGRAEVEVVVEDGEIAHAYYRFDRAVVFSHGRWTLGGEHPEPPWMRGAVPSWHPDPLGRHQMRYWDGARWTAHVADTGRVSTDPL